MNRMLSGKVVDKRPGVSHDETQGHATKRCDADMEPTTTFAQVAEMVAGLGALGLLTGALNMFALRVVRVDEVPGCVRARIRWWSSHNPAFIVTSAAVTVAGLVMMVAAAT